MSHVSKPPKSPCRNVDYRGQGPSYCPKLVLSISKEVGQAYQMAGILHPDLGFTSPHVYMTRLL